MDIRFADAEHKAYYLWILHANPLARQARVAIYRGMVCTVP